MPTLTTRSGCRARGRPEPVGADVGEHDARPRVVVEQLGGGVDEAVPHVGSSAGPRRRRRAAGPRWRGVERPLRARRDRGRRPSSRRPALAGEPRGDAARPAVGGGRVVDDDHRQRVEADPAGERDRLVVASPRPARASPTRHKTRGSCGPGRAGRARRRRRAAARGRASRRRSRRPGTSVAVRVVAERRVERAEAVQPCGRGRTRAPPASRSRPAARGPSRAGSGRGRASADRRGRCAARGRRGPAAPSSVEKALGSCFSSPSRRARSGRPRLRSRQA